MISVGFGVSAGLGDRGIYEPADHAADKDGQSGSDGEICAHGEGQGTDAEQLNRDDDEDAEQDQSPGELAAENAVDDGGHEAGLRGGRLFAADAGNPLDFDLLGGGRVEIFAVGEFGGAESVEDDVFAGGVLGGYFRCVDDGDVLGEVGVGLDVDAVVGLAEIPGLRGGAELLKGGVHGGEGDADDDGGDADADHECELLEAGSCADEVAGLEVLGGVAGVGSGDADCAADGDGEGSEGGSRPALEEEDGRGGHEGGNGHAADG